METYSGISEHFGASFVASVKKQNEDIMQWVAANRSESKRREEAEDDGA